MHERRARPGVLELKLHQVLRLLGGGRTGREGRGLRGGVFPREEEGGVKGAGR